MTKVFFAIFFFSMALVSDAQVQVKPFASRDSLNIYCDKIMQTFQDGKFSEGMQMFKQHSVMDIVAINNLDKTINEQMANILPVYKRVIAYELIEEKILKNSLVRRRYLLKFENYFLTFDFIQYNNGSSWTVSNFNYYDEPKGLF